MYILSFRLHECQGATPKCVLQHALFISHYNLELKVQHPGPLSALYYQSSASLI